MKILSEKKLAALSLGSNSPDAESIFDAACKRLAAGGFRVLRRSYGYRTKPVDCAPGTPDFTNAALTGEWDASPEELLTLTQSIEIASGRPADHGYHTARTLDLDIILCGDAVQNTPRLTLPHPAAQKRRFVLEPLNEIAPDWRFPDSGQTVAEALRKLPAEGNR